MVDTEDSRRIKANRFIDSHFDWHFEYGLTDWFSMQEYVQGMCPNWSAKLTKLLETFYRAKVEFIRGNMTAEAFMVAVEDWSVASLEAYDRFVKD